MKDAAYFMKRALACAKKAASLGEVPVGAVVVRDGKVIASGYNRRETGKNALLHAEIIALHRACKKVGDWRLSDCDLYVTLEPCSMCTGAILNSRIRRVYLGADDPKEGCMGGLCDMTALPFPHRPEVIRSVCKEECEELLTSFFRSLREANVTPPEEIILRPFEEADAPILKQYLYPNRSQRDLCRLIAQWNTEQYEGRYCAFFAVIAKDCVVGYVNLCEQPDGSVSVGASIFAGFRGKTYGTQGVLRILRIAKEKGYSVATARVRQSNTPSNRLCDRVGFLRTGEDVTKEGRPVFTYHIELTLFSK